MRVTGHSVLPLKIADYFKRSSSALQIDAPNAQLHLGLNALSLILGPYLINVKKLSYDDAFDIIEGWMNKCDSIKRLDSNFNYHIKYALENSIKRCHLPMKFET